MLVAIFRILAEADDHDDHHDEEEGTSEKSTILLVKWFILILLAISGSFVFFPYMKSVRD